ncbi:glycosyltransferase [Nitrosopumilus sp.]|jgi:glycosyltransferase involved in cell wall biosynthesis|nr:glycosyltransferase [Nitrosopumilus sp.]
MKILNVNFGLPGLAGDSNQLFTISKNLMLLGHDVTIVTTDAEIWKGDKQKSEQYSKVRELLKKSTETSVKINGVNIIPLHCSSQKIGMYCPNAKKFARKIVKEYDVVHIFNWYHHLGMTFAEVCNEQNIPFVISFYATLQENAHSYKKFQKKIIDIIYTKKLIQKANMLHSVGDLETQEYIKWGVNSKNICRVENVINLEDYKIKKTTNILKKLNIEKENYFVFISRIHPKKGLDLLFAAFAKFLKTQTKIILVVAGTGSEEYENKVKKLATDLGIDDFIKFAGFITNNEKLELLKEAEIFVLTSHSDIHPTAIQEALTMGKPALITRACDYPEIEEYDAGIVAENTVDSVFQGLKQILNNSDLSELSKNASKLIREKYLVENLIKSYEDMYINAINNQTKK